MNRRMLTSAAVFGLLVGLGVASRFVREMVPETPPCFHAVMAVALFSGFYFRSLAVATAVPFTTMIVSDMFIGGYAPTVMLANYIALALPIAWRTVLKANLTGPKVVLGAIASSLAFYLISNFAVWAFQPWYPHTLAGLARCYASALPFLGHSLWGELTYSSLLFGGYAWATGVFSAPAQMPRLAPVSQ